MRETQILKDCNMLTPNAAALVTNLHRLRNPLHRLATATALFALLIQTVIPGPATPVMAQVRTSKPLNKPKKNTKKKKSTPQVYPLGRFTLPELVMPQQKVADQIPPPSIETSDRTIVKVTRQQNTSSDDRVESETIAPKQGIVVDFRTVAASSKSKVIGRISRPAKPTVFQDIPSPGSIEEAGPAVTGKPSSPLSITSADVGGPLLASPAPAVSFQGEIDQAKIGTGIFTIPPDTMGAVGFDKVVTYLNNNIKIQDKTTGAQLSIASIDSFWTPTGATGAFDPRTQFDPYNNRWLIAATSNAQSANSSVLLGISNTSDPQGTYTLFRFTVGCAPGAVGCDAGGEWADFPMLGFNKNWIAIGWNQFTINTSAFVAGKVLILDYPTARAGTATGSTITNPSNESGFCMHPATTFSATENTLYVPTHQLSSGALYRLHSITGTPAAPVFNVDGTARTRPGGGWTQPGGDNLPQQCIPGVGAPTQTCPASPRGIEAADAFIRSNVVFRNGRIYYAQSIALPAGGLTSNSRFAVQWTALNPDGTFSDGGRVEDPTAQVFNGGKHYAYSSLSVNKKNDVLLGFSEFESDDYADAGYAFRFGTDAPGTMRDPVIYKEGEDYYSKTFSGTRNRWGDFSHTVVDPTNDRDLWTIQEYPTLRVGTTGQGTNDSRWATWWAKIDVPSAGDLIISEFRLHGPAGADDEFVEIYNSNSSSIIVQTMDGSEGYALAADDGVVRFTIPNGTVIPARGHYLGVNSIGYSLGSYPGGLGTTATGDATYTIDIDSGGDLDSRPGIALFNTSNSANFNLANRLDAVGFAGTANTLYKEGAGIPNPTVFDKDHSFYRSLCPGNTPVFGSSLGCAAGSGGLPKDTNANEDDFVYVDTTAGQRLGAPGPQNLSAPIERNAQFATFLLDSMAGASLPPNRVRDTTPGPFPQTFGTMSIRRRIVNGTGGPVTRLRFRIIDLNTFPPSASFADLRALTSLAVVVSGINDAATCSPLPTPCTMTVKGTELESPPSQPNGGAFNSSLSAGTVTLATPLAPGASLNVQFLLGVQQTGVLRFYMNVEALP